MTKKRTKKQKQFEELCSEKGLEEAIVTMCLTYNVTSQELYKFVTDGKIQDDGIQYFLESTFDETKIVKLKDYFLSYINTENKITSSFQLYFLDEYALKYATLEEIAIYYDKLEQESLDYQKYIKRNRATDNYRFTEHITKVFRTLSNKEKEVYLESTLYKLNGIKIAIQNKKFTTKDVLDMIKDFAKSGFMTKREKEEIEDEILSYKNYLIGKKEFAKYDRSSFTEKQLKNPNSVVSRIKRYFNGQSTFEDMMSIRGDQFESYLLHFPEDREKVDQLRSLTKMKKAERATEKRNQQAKEYKEQQNNEFSKEETQKKIAEIMTLFLTTDLMTITELSEKTGVSVTTINKYRNFLKATNPELSHQIEETVAVRKASNLSRKKAITNSLYYMIKKGVPTLAGKRSLDIIDFEVAIAPELKRQECLNITDSTNSPIMSFYIKGFFEEVDGINASDEELVYDQKVVEKLISHQLPVTKATYLAASSRFNNLDSDIEFMKSYKTLVQENIAGLLRNMHNKDGIDQLEVSIQKKLGTYPVE